MSAADIGMHADRRKHIESRHTYRPGRMCRKRKKPVNPTSSVS